ncbi:hypothetical protein VCJ71_07640 [Alteriqipengyuania sp. WL0013]|uniref:hypothetical protein n=1 Tax=Alteriqipengyuania sp. WL0013 TaxID=3110773 RepID=UPI002C3D2299|nr:hypothetical protein [Alteriqipengyuania sp. WL0013]MEB3415935.1 hypothetical protein [Alteriqipengyuania sp. WL0013]
MGPENQKILVLDDEALIAFDLAATVANLGYAVAGPAISLDEGFRIFEAENPDLALLDIDVDGSPVWPLARKLAAKGCRLVFVSADVSHSQLCDEFSRSPLIEKPASPAQIGEAISAAGGLH